MDACFLFWSPINLLIVCECSFLILAFNYNLLIVCGRIFLILVLESTHSMWTHCYWVVLFRCGDEGVPTKWNFSALTSTYFHSMSGPFHFLNKYFSIVQICPLSMCSIICWLKSFQWGGRHYHISKVHEKLAKNSQLIVINSVNKTLCLWRGVRSYAQCGCNVLAKFWRLLGCFKRLDW